MDEKQTNSHALITPLQALHEAKISLQTSAKNVYTLLETCFFANNNLLKILNKNVVKHNHVTVA